MSPSRRSNQRITSQREKEDIVRQKTYVRIFLLLSQIRQTSLSGLCQTKHVFTT